MLARKPTSASGTPAPTAEACCKLAEKPFCGEVSGEAEVGPRECGRVSNSTVGSSFADEALKLDYTRIPRSGDCRMVSPDSKRTDVVLAVLQVDDDCFSVTSESSATKSKEVSYFPRIQEEMSINSIQPSIMPDQGAIDDDATADTWEYTIASNQAFDLSGTARALFSTKAFSHSSKFQRRQSRYLSLSRRLSDLTVNQLHFGALGRLYGRDRECRMLREAWKEVLMARNMPGTSVAGDHRHYEESSGKTAGRCLFTVSGLSGTGKSALAETLRDTVQRDGGFFLHGKFPQQHRLSRHSVEPYVAFAAACGELCELIVSLYAPSDGLAQDEESSQNSTRYLKFTLDQFREKLNQDIGTDALVLTKVVPGLLQVLKVDSTADECYSESIGMLEAHHQFKFAFRRFIRAVTSFGPIVLTLDDLQWADTASMELLEALISDRENTSLMAIAIYRSDDIFSNQPHIKSIDNIKEMSVLDSSLKVVFISIGDIAVEQVNHLLVDLLSSTEDETRALAECVHKKTLGNIFFVIQFITMLRELELLEYNFGVLKWTWDIQKIQASTVATANVVSLMKEKMRRLPVSIGKILPIMACLGSSFSGSVFELVVDGVSHLWRVEPEEAIRQDDRRDSECDLPALQRKTLDCLTRCEKEGLIEVGSEDHTYVWVHDKIQEAAFSLITEDELQALKLELGKALYERLDPVGFEKNLFVVADLLNVESPGVTSLPYQQPVKVAIIYLRAGLKTMESSAFEQATGYLLLGIGLLPADHWQSVYDLSLELYSSAAEAEYCVGNFDKAREYCNQIIRQEHRPWLDKQRAYKVVVESTAAEHRHSDALALCRTILSQFGYKFPRTGVSLHVRAGVMWVKSTLEKQTPEKIRRLPPMTDATKLWVMALLDMSTTYSYWIKSDLLPLAIFKGLRITLNEGVSDYSPAMFTLVGFFLVAYLNDYKGGEKCANIGIALLNQVRSARKVESRVVHLSHVLVFHWSRPVTLSLKPLLSGYEVGMAMGDTGSGAWCIKSYIEVAFRTGTPLEVLLADCAFYSEQLREVKQLKILAIMKNLWQVILFLTGENRFSGALSGDVVDQEKVLREAKNSFDHSVANLYRHLMYVAFVFGDHETVYELVEKTGMADGCYDKMSPGTLGLCHLNAFNGLSMISLYRQTKDRKYLVLAKQMAGKIRKWAASGNPNVVHYDALFDAEMDSIRGDVHKAAKRFEVAVTYSGRRGLTQDQALAHERFGEHFVRLGPGHVRDAEFHLGEAVKLYDEWGAKAKVKHLQRAHRAFFNPPSEIQLQLVF